MAKKSIVALRDSGRFTVVRDLTMGCDDTAAKSEGDLGECGEGLVTIHPEEVEQVAASEGVIQHDSEWYEMGFFTRWISSGGEIIFCFDVPQTLHDGFQTRVLSVARKSW